MTKQAPEEVFDRATSFSSLATVHSSEDVPAKGPRGVLAQHRLRTAYINVFTGRASREDADIVLVDLARVSGYYNTTSPQTPADELKFYEGQRSVFGRIYSMINPSSRFMAELAKGVAAEMAIDATQGEIS